MTVRSTNGVYNPPEQWRYAIFRQGRIVGYWCARVPKGTSTITDAGVTFTCVPGPYGMCAYLTANSATIAEIEATNSFAGLGF